MSSLHGAGSGEWRRNWKLVLACAFGLSFASVLNQVFGLFMEPLGEEFGWSRAQISIGLSMSGVVSVLLSPVVGMMVDRYGVRRLALPCIVLLTLSMAALSLANGSYTQWIALWAIYSIVDLGVKSTVWTTAVAYAFKAERSLAIAFTLGGVTIGQIIGPPLTQVLIDGYGWRTAFLAIAVIWGAVAFLLSFFFLHEERHVGPDTENTEATTMRRVANGLTVAQAMRSLVLIRIGIATFITMLLGLGVWLHMASILAAGGASRAQAAYLLSLYGVAGIAGKLITGWLMDRVHAGLIGSVTLAVSAVAYALLLDDFRTQALTIVAILVTGYASAAKLQICAYMTSRYAGMRSYGTIFGFMSSLVALGGGLGPFVAGLIFDAYGSYDPLILACTVGTFIAAALIVGLGAYPDWEEPGAKEAA